MTARRVGVAALAAALLTLSSCGGGAHEAPSLSQLPLAPGAQISVRQQVCDTGAASFCAWELVVVGSGYRDSDALFVAEHRHLLKLGWSGAAGDIGDEHAADSPGHKLRLTYATPTGDLKGIDEGSIRRSSPVTLALSRAFFYHVPVLSILLEQGST
ncbi:MAG: hypothetical protein M3Z27_08335 [Actinomycetota bacterium]|nr:hypothetical protein [Actinomycetota bacterium]